MMKHSYEFIKNQIEKEGYELLSSEYKNALSNIKIKCDRGHEFEMRFNNFFSQKQRCPICFGTPKHSYEFVKEQIEKNGYELISTEYKGNKIKLQIICNKGHEYEVKYNSIQLGNRCPKCKYINQGNIQRHSFEFVKEQIEKEGYKLLSKKYINAFDYLKIQCDKGHEYEVKYNDFRNGGRCPICNPKTSKGEKEIIDYLKSLNLIVEERNRTIIHPLELDIVIPEKKIAIEYCGLYWHSEEAGKCKNYHLNKLEACAKMEYRLITIFEDEWLNKQRIVKNRLKYILGLETERIYARECKIIVIDKKLSEDFLNEYHIQGYKHSTKCLGAVYDFNLVAVMTFKKRTDNIYELNRFCTTRNVVGIAGKLLKYFQKHYAPDKIITFADRRWSKGNLYEKIGMIKDKILRPDYSYFKTNNVYGITRFHKFDFRHKRMQKKLDNYNSELSEKENMKNNGWVRIYDCGKIRYILEVNE